MATRVIVPIRLRLDAATVEALPTIVEAFSVAFDRAVTGSMHAVVRPEGARPAVGAPPSFTWSGEGLSSVGADARLRLERAIGEAVGARTHAWGVANVRTEQPPSPPGPAAARAALDLRDEIERARIEQIAEAASANWSRWLAIVLDWTPSDTPGSIATTGALVPDARVRRTAQAAAFASRLEGALDFVPDAPRIIAGGFVDRPAAAPAALDRMVEELDRGFIAAFVVALRSREFLDWTTGRAIVPLVVRASEPLVLDSFHERPVAAEELTGALLKAFPPTEGDQILGMPLKIDFDRLVARFDAIAGFRNALVARGLDPLDAAEFTVNFLHSLFEALVDAYRRVMRDAVERAVAIQRVFARPEGDTPMPQREAATLTAQFDALVASVSGRTPAAAIESGRELGIVRERLDNALRLATRPAAEWRAEVRPLETGFVLVLRAPDAGGPGQAYYATDPGRAELRGLLYSYAAMCGEWRSIGCRGLVWRTGIEWLDPILSDLVRELTASDDARTLMFAERDRDGD